MKMRSMGDKEPKAEIRTQRPSEGTQSNNHEIHEKERMWSVSYFSCGSCLSWLKHLCPYAESCPWRLNTFRLSAFGFLSAFSLRVSDLAILGTFTLCLLIFSPAKAQSLPDTTLTQIRFDQKPNAQISPDLAFVDESGKPVRLGDYFGSKPLVLVLGYYECPMLCTLVLNGMMESAEDMKWSIGREFEVVNVSINPHETTALAAAKQRAYVRRYGRVGSEQGWHFLTGNEKEIRQLADEVGFRYAYDPASKQYAHPSGLIMLTPEGKISSYLFGVNFPSKELFAGLNQARARQVSSPIQQFILLCFHYNPITGKHSGLILIVLRIFGAVTMLGVVGLIIILVRRGRAAEAILSTTERSLGAAAELSKSK